ncbi:c-type cytochrome [Haliea sp. E17]|uniref:c-type cytochrome n=1 Tax=Haliea sp. E17 TaxID=3401576 RepID=UPI003AADA3CB
MLLSLAAPASEQEIRDDIALGSQVFAEICAKCHQDNGEGEGALYPSLHNPALLHDRSLLIQTILNGRKGHLEGAADKDTTLMPPLNFLTDTEIVAIIAYITNSWGGEVLVVTEKEVQAARASMPSSE